MSESLLELCNGRKQPLLVTEVRHNYHMGDSGEERGNTVIEFYISYKTSIIIEQTFTH